MRKKLRNLIRIIHLWLGLLTGLVVFIVSITGCIFVFEEEIRGYVHQSYTYVSPQDKDFIGLDKIIDNFKEEKPKAKITSIRINNAEENAAVVIVSKGINYYFNPYTAKLLKSHKRDFLTTVQEIHTSLLLGETGKLIVGFSVIFFLFALITGFVLWFPARVRLIRQSFTIKFKASFKRINYDLHNVLGFYASIFLIVIALTGLYFAFKEAKDLAGFLAGEKLSKGKEVTGPSFSQAKDETTLYSMIYKQVLLRFPQPQSTTFSVRKTGELRLRLLYPYQWARKQETLFFDLKDKKFIREKLYKDFNKADFIEASNYDLHTGRMFGLTGKIIAFFVSLIAASLPITGFLIWYRKQFRSKPKEACKVLFDLNVTP